MKLTKAEKGMAKEIIEIWLEKYNNDPNLAYAEFLRGHMEMDIDIPYWMNNSGLNDFITMSKK